VAAALLRRWKGMDRSEQKSATAWLLVDTSDHGQVKITSRRVSLSHFIQ